MTDYEKLKALLTEFGVGFVDEPSFDGRVVCYEGDEKIEGFRGYYTEFHFSADGRFINMGAWELNP